MYTEYRIINNIAIIKDKDKKIEERKEISQIEAVLVKKNKIEKMIRKKEKIKHLLETEPPLKEIKAKVIKKVFIGTLLILIMNLIALLAVNNFYLKEVLELKKEFYLLENILFGAEMVMCEAINIYTSYKSYRVCKKERMGLMAQLHFLKEEIPKEVLALEALESLNQAEKREDTKEKKVPYKKILKELKVQLYNWKYYGEHYAYYSRKIKRNKFNIKDKRDMEQYNVDYHSYLNFLKQDKLSLNLEMKKKANL